MLAGRDAVPAGGARNPVPGRPREPIGRHYDRSAGSLLDWDWPIRLVPGNADPGNRNRRRGAPRGARAPDNGARQDGRRQRRSALHPLALSRGRKRKTAYPAPQRIRAMTPGCLTIASVKGHALRTFAVMRGLDPRIRDASPRVIDFHKAAVVGAASWMAGSSPAMTKNAPRHVRHRHSQRPVRHRLCAGAVGLVLFQR
jgi:hypothetical protein